MSARAEVTVTETVHEKWDGEKWVPFARETVTNTRTIPEPSIYGARWEGQ